ncbi:hypothetical protein MPLSOD_140701 [Mesorhizobium sp. SOD10]|nr:hypothetical protein MPLSOD_140701 [Mesorhizobium sp. SOD10]
MVGHPQDHRQEDLAGLASAEGNDRPRSRQGPLPADLSGRRHREPARRARALSRHHRIPHPRHQSALDDRRRGVFGLHPHAQRRRRRSLRARECRNHGRGDIVTANQPVRRRISFCSTLLPLSHSAIPRDVLKPVSGVYGGRAVWGYGRSRKGSAANRAAFFVFEFPFDAWRGKSPRKQAVSLSGLISRRASAIAAQNPDRYAIPDATPLTRFSLNCCRRQRCQP